MYVCVCVDSTISSYIVAGCSLEVNMDQAILDCGRSFHKIGVVQKIPFSYGNKPTKARETKERSKVCKMNCVEMLGLSCDKNMYVGQQETT